MGTTLTKHILMIAYSNYRLDNRVRRVSKALASIGEYEVAVLAPKIEDYPRNYRVDGVNIMELNVSHYRGKSQLSYLMSYIKFFLYALFACTKLFVQGRVDIAHIHNMPDFMVFAALTPRLFGRKVILDIHDSMPETYSAKYSDKSNILFKLLCLEESLSCRFAQKIICVNHPQRDVLIERGIPGNKIHICINTPDEVWFNSNRCSKDKNENSRSFKLVYHGTLAKRLGIDLVIQAVSMLAGKIPDLEFHVIGSGDDSNDFATLARSLGIDDRIFFHKTIPHDCIAATLQGMQLGVVANRKNIATELMLPVKMLEYVALNIPVVVPRLKTIQFYFTDDMVIYFDPENVDSLVAAIREAYYNETKRLKQTENARRFLTRYGWDKHKYDLFSLYRSLA